MEMLKLFILLVLTPLAFGLVTWLSSPYQKNSLYQLMSNPLILSTLLISGFLIFLGIDYQQYKFANKPFFFLLDTAIVTLAVPLYQQFFNFKQISKPLLITLIFSAFFASISALGFLFILGSETNNLISLAPKSVTTPIALRISEKIGGDPSMTTGIVVLTGMIGALFGPIIFKKLNIFDDRVKGFILGISAHGIGAAKAFKISQKCGAFATLGLSLTGILTALILPYIIIFIF